MNSVQRSQLKLSYNHYYNKNGNNFINIDQLKRGNQYFAQYQQNKQSNKLLNHIIRNRKQSYEGSTDQYVHYDQLQQRINSFLNEQQKKDHTTMELIFEMLDQNKDGLIDRNDFQTFLRSVGSTMNEKDVNGFFELMTTQGTHLGKKEFQIIFQHI